MTARRAGSGGTHGSRPTGCGGHPGRTGSSAPTRQNRSRAKRDVEDAVPYEITRGVCKGADRVVRPYKTKQEPREAGRRGRRPLRNHKGCVQRGGRRRPHLQGRTGAVRNGTAGTACPTNRRGAARTAKFRNFFFPLSASAGLRRLYSDDTGRPPVL